MSLIGLTVMGLGNAVKLYTMHEHWLICPMHVLWKFDREICQQPSCFLCQLKDYRPPQLWRYTNLLGNSLQHVDSFIAPSIYTKDRHLESGLNIPIVHIPHFLPAQESDHAIIENSSPHAKKYFLYVGRLEKVKGVQNLIQVFKNFSQADLLIIGDGVYRDTLAQMAAGVSNIHLINRLTYQELIPYYCHAVAVLIPSLCPEVFGLVAIEAFIHSIPVIAHTSGGLAEIMRESGGGVIYQTDAELCAAMENFLADETLSHRLGEKGFKAYQQLWTADSHINQYLSLIEQLLKNR